MRPALSISSIVFIPLNKYVASYCILPLQYVVLLLTSGSSINNNDFLVGNMAAKELTCEELVKTTHQLLEGLNVIEMKLVLAIVKDSVNIHEYLGGEE